MYKIMGRKTEKDGYTKVEAEEYYQFDQALDSIPLLWLLKKDYRYYQIRKGDCVKATFEFHV